MNHNQNKLRSIESATHVVMFWLLTLMAVALFVPCVLVPIWVENEAVR
ncbi:MAG: hypothetical protein JSV03_10470 [Planctomycetota bacterium]|nr:MAG: hypothetical protein JSV03_10470 [Planctomycetota bacterium]